MECQMCRKKKLTSEYPSNPLSEACDHHHLLICLRCIIKAVEDSYACPVNGCTTCIDPDECIGMWECKAKLKQLTFDYSDREKAYNTASAAAAASSTASPGEIAVFLTTLLGESHEVKASLTHTVDALKDSVIKHWKEHGSKSKVKLLFNGVELADTQTLQAAGLGNGCRVQVLFVLLELTPDLTEVRMSMSWGWPNGRDHTDYLDTACLTFSTEGGRAIFLHCIDFRTQRQHGRHEIGEAISNIYDNYVRHDGEARKSPTTRTSESSFTVFAQNLDGLVAPTGRFLPASGQPRGGGGRGGGGRNPASRMVSVTHLFFVIFTFRDTDIARFGDPRLQVFDQAKPEEPLCGTDLNPRAKGMIVCMLSRPGRRGGWAVNEIGQSLDEGSVRDYRPVANLCCGILNRMMQQH